jgi:hypothetical protein
MLYRLYISNMLRRRHQEGPRKQKRKLIEWDTSASADGVNLLGENIKTINKTREILLGAREEVCLKETHRKLIICSCLVTRLQDNIII